jgi:hypothetical protein
MTDKVNWGICENKKQVLERTHFDEDAVSFIGFATTFLS